MNGSPDKKSEPPMIEKSRISILKVPKIEWNRHVSNHFETPFFFVFGEIQWSHDRMYSVILEFKSDPDTKILFVYNLISISLDGDPVFWLN